MLKNKLLLRLSRIVAPQVGFDPERSGRRIMVTDLSGKNNEVLFD